MNDDDDDERKLCHSFCCKPSACFDTMYQLLLCSDFLCSIFFYVSGEELFFILVFHFSFILPGR